MVHNVLTILADICDGQTDALKALLMGNSRNLVRTDSGPQTYPELPTTHFLRWVVVPRAVPQSPDILAFESNFDGSIDEYLASSIAENRVFIVSIYRHCESFPTDDSDEGIARYLRRRIHPYAALHVAYPNLTRQNIAQQKAMRERIETFLDTQRAELSSLTPLQIQERIAIELKGAGVFPNQVPKAGDFANLFGQFPRIVVFAVQFLVVLLLLPLFVLALRRREMTDPAIEDMPVVASRDVRDLEDNPSVVQNQLTHLVPIKAGWFRLRLLKMVFLAIDLLARTKYTHGKLGSIASIHFARWVILPDRRLLFFSNYDGSWENYLGDFVDKASRGLTAVWSNSELFPKTRWLILDGSRDGHRFLHWTRQYQIPTQFWHSWHQDQSVKNILNNDRVCDGLFGHMNEDQAQEWLNLI